MAENASLVAKLAADYPSLRFEQGDLFRWSPDAKTIHYVSVDSPKDTASLLHELGHGLCGHDDFTHDIELLKMEREAWTKAQSVASKYDVVISEDIIEDALDSYRDWLDARSRCPNCSQNGIQETENSYRCIICHINWRVNDARQCGLKRYRI